MAEESRTEYQESADSASRESASGLGSPTVGIQGFLQAATAGAIVMAGLGGIAFYLVFPADLLEDFVYPRRPPSIWYQIAAIISAALLMTAAYVVARPAHRGRRVAAGFGALLGILASGPAQLALAAVVRSNPWRNVAIVCWTTASWCVAGTTISWFLTLKPPKDFG
jgi:hypothetical protein